MNFFKIRVSHIVLFLMISTSINAQGSEFEKGSLLLESGETLTGYIKKMIFKEVSSTVAFKTSLDDLEKKYSVQKVQGFNFIDRNIVYRRVEFQSIVDKANGEGSTVRFAKVLVDGAVELLKVTLKGEENIIAFGSKPYMYILRKDGQTIQLNLLKTTIQRGEKIVTKSYLGRLSNTLSECANIERAVLDSKFSDQSLISLIEEYYDCIGYGEGFKSYKVERKKIMSHYVSIGNHRIMDSKLIDPLGLNASYGITFYNPEEGKLFGGGAELGLLYNKYRWNDFGIGEYSDLTVAFNAILDVYVFKKKNFALVVNGGLNSFFRNPETLGTSHSYVMIFYGARVQVSSKINFYMRYATHKSNRQSPDKMANFGVSYRIL